MFLAIINMILIIMIFGITLLGNLFQNIVEKILINLILIFIKKDRKFKFVIYKNMESHRKRNKKTAIMYTLALTFLIFAGTGFNL